MASFDRDFYNYFKDVAEQHLKIGSVTQMQWDTMLAQWNLGQLKDFVLILEQPDATPRGMKDGYPMLRIDAAFTVAHKAKVGDAHGNNDLYDEINQIILDILGRLIHQFYPVRPKDFFMRFLNDDFNIVATLPLNSRTFIGKRCQFSYETVAGIQYNSEKWQ